MQNILPYCLEITTMVLKLKFHQKRQNSELWVLLKLPQKFKITFQTQIEMKMDFLLALMTRLN